jgi:hypothetical protein
VVLCAAADSWLPVELVLLAVLVLLMLSKQPVEAVNSLLSVPPDVNRPKCASTVSFPAATAFHDASKASK